MDILRPTPHVKREGEDGPTRISSSDKRSKDLSDDDEIPAIGFIGNKITRPHHSADATDATDDDPATPSLREFHLNQLQKQGADDDDDEDEDETEYILTITDEAWTFGNPTGVSTSTGDNVTATYLLFTDTALRWHDRLTGQSTPGTPDMEEPSTLTSTETETPTTTEVVTTMLDASSTDDNEDEDPTAGEHVSEPTTLVGVTTPASDAPSAITGDNSSPSSGGDTGISSGAIIGIVAGIGGLTTAVVAALLVFFRRRQKKSAHGLTASDDPPSQQEQKEPSDGEAGPQRDNPGKEIAEGYSHYPASSTVAEMEHQERGPVELSSQESADAGAGAGAQQNWHFHGQHQKAYIAELPADTPFGPCPGPTVIDSRPTSL